MPAAVVAMLLAQCAGHQGEDCRLPSSPPPALSLLAIAVWIGAVILALFVAWQLFSWRRVRRQLRRGRAHHARRGLPLPSGEDDGR